MSKSTPPARRNRLSAVMIMALIITAIGIAASTAISSPALGLDKPIFTPTHARSFALAEIAKPTYTALPTVTSLPTPTLTITPEPMAQAEIILDTPASEYLAPIGEEKTFANQYQSTYGGEKNHLFFVFEKHQ